MIEIRNPQKSEKEKIKDLWRYCFNETEEFIEYYFANRYDENDVLSLFYDKSLSSMLHLNKYSLNIRDIVHISSYIVGVAVAPEYRGQGLMNDLIKYTLNYQYNAGEIFSILMPIETQIYLRYGYINCFDISEYSIKLEDILYKKTDCSIEKIEKITEKTVKDLNVVYKNAVEGCCAYNIREKKYWNKKFEEVMLENGNIFLVYEGKKPSGYFILFPKNQEFGLVSELVFTTKNSYHSILNMIKSHSTQFKQVKIFTPQNFIFSLFADNNNKFIHTRKPFMMGRVINARQVLDNIFAEQDLSKYGFDIEIVDNQIKDNNFVYSNKGKNKKYAKIDISALAQIYTKYANIKELYLAKKVETVDLDFFEKLFGIEKKENFINEYF